jgi:hypothetical protein
LEWYNCLKVYSKEVKIERKLNCNRAPAEQENTSNFESLANKLSDFKIGPIKEDLGGVQLRPLSEPPETQMSSLNMRVACTAAIHKQRRWTCITYVPGTPVV